MFVPPNGMHRQEIIYCIKELVNVRLGILL